MPRGLLLSPNAGIRRTLEETDHLVHISVQETELRTQIAFHRRHSSIRRNAFHDSWFFLSRSRSLHHIDVYSGMQSAPAYVRHRRGRAVEQAHLDNGGSNAK